MSSTKLVLIFLGFVFVIIVLLTSNQIAAGLRKNFGGFLPQSLKLPNNIKTTPTPSHIPTPTFTPTPVLSVIGEGKISSNEIPATGPENFLYFLLGSSGLIGIALKKVADRS